MKVTAPSLILEPLQFFSNKTEKCCKLIQQILAK